MRVDTDADMADHRANRFKVVIRKLFTTRFAAEQDQTGNFTANDHRQHELNPLCRQNLVIASKKRSRTRSMFYQRVRNLAAEKRFHLGFVDINSIENLIAQTPNGNTTKWTRTVAFNDRTTSQRERAKEQVHRRSHHLVEIASAGNFLS